ESLGQVRLGASCSGGVTHPTRQPMRVPAAGNSPLKCLVPANPRAHRDLARGILHTKAPPSSGSGGDPFRRLVALGPAMEWSAANRAATRTTSAPSVRSCDSTLESWTFPFESKTRQAAATGTT